MQWLEVHIIKAESNEVDGARDISYSSPSKHQAKNQEKCGTN